MDIARLRQVRTHSICAENYTGAPGMAALATDGTGAHAARDLGQGWKVSPSVAFGPGETFTLASIDGPGCIQHIWLTTHHDNWRTLVLRAYWDGADEPAIEVPVGDFFCSGWGRFAQVSSAMVAVNPSGGFNSYWPMPFGSGARLTLENVGEREVVVYYQVTYETGGDYAGLGYLHAQFRRSNPLAEGSTHVLVADVEGAGHYVGTYVAWGSNSNGWWGEGEVKFWLDDDDAAPSIASTGTEDYFGGAWNFDVDGTYRDYTAPYCGLPQVIRPDGAYSAQMRFGMYRWHVPDPVRFAHRLGKVDIQALGWRRDGRYRLLSDDIASTCWFYLDRPTCTRPAFATRDELEI